jgi:predicted Zn-ribbon and HTH transcriptional regulator
VSAGVTRRQEIAALLEAGDWSFDELRRELQVAVRTLEDDLRHVERSHRRGARRLRVEPARCEACGFVFRRREPRHWHPPSRCPGCRSERIVAARLRIAD